jgi:DNA-directed RNA polymerase subunit L
MKVTVERNDPPELVFVAEDVDQAVMNSLRRVIMSEVPYVAIDKDSVMFFKNTHVLHNHFFAARLSMLPLHLSRGEADAYIPGSIKVFLDVKNDSTKVMDITSADLKVTLHDREHPDTARLFPPSDVSGDHVLLTVLKPGEAIKCEATVVKGHGHASFAVASKVAYSPILDPELLKVAREKAGKSDREQNRFEHIDSKRCFVRGPDGDPRAFRFVVETECGMSAVDIVEAALTVLENKCATVKARFLENAGTGITTLEIPNEGHTLGNLLQSCGVDDLMGPDKPLKFVGYHCPHPLEKRFVMNVVSDDPMASFEAMKEAAAKRLADLRFLLSEETARWGAGVPSPPRGSQKSAAEIDDRAKSTKVPTSSVEAAEVVAVPEDSTMPKSAKASKAPTSAMEPTEAAGVVKALKSAKSSRSK